MINSPEFKRNALIGVEAASVIWLLAWLFYIHINLGWLDLFSLLPHELGAFLAGIFTPLLFLWVVLARSVGRLN